MVYWLSEDSPVSDSIGVTNAPPGSFSTPVTEGPSTSPISVPDRAALYTLEELSPPSDCNPEGCASECASAAASGDAGEPSVLASADGAGAELNGRAASIAAASAATAAASGETKPENSRLISSAMLASLGGMSGFGVS